MGIGEKNVEKNDNIMILNSSVKQNRTIQYNKTWTRSRKTSYQYLENARPIVR